MQGNTDAMQQGGTDASQGRPAWVSSAGEANLYHGESLQVACEHVAQAIGAMRGPDGMWHGSTSTKASTVIHRALKSSRDSEATGDIVDHLASAIERSAKPRNRGVRLLVCGTWFDVRIAR